MQPFVSKAVQTGITYIHSYINISLKIVRILIYPLHTQVPRRTLSMIALTFLAQTLGIPGEAAPTRPRGKAKRAGAGAGSTGGSVGVRGGGAGGSDRYVSAFDLSSKAFRPGKPLHDRVLSCLGGAPGSADYGEGVAVDIVVCSWGEAGGGGGNLEGEDGTATGGGRIRGGLSEQEVNIGGDAATDSAAEGSGGGTSSKGGHGEGGSEKHHQRQQPEREREQWCREIAFPSGFSAERVDLTPSTRFFREACCPDLDFVGQGFAATAANGGENPGQLGDHASDSPPKPPSPLGTTKCRLVLDLFEWLGAVSCGLDAAISRDPSPPEPYLSEFETPRHLRYRRSRVVCRARLRGFLPPLAVARFVKAAASAAAATTDARGAEANGDLASTLSSASDTRAPELRRPDGSSWGSVTAWLFRDAPRAYPGADAPCAGGQRSKRGGGGRGGEGGNGVGGKGVAERLTKEWPVGGHGVYAVVACPGETAVAYVSARCPGPGW